MLSQKTGALYSRVRNRARWGVIWSALTGHPRCLLTLNETCPGCTMHAHDFAGVQTVPISQILGSVSASRSSDFDRDFNPLHDRMNERWLRVASAQQGGKALPPVNLIQVGKMYFVQDGHHRISVEMARGQKEVTASVTICRENQMKV